MSSVKIFPLAVIIFIVVIIFTGINIIGQESLTNSNIDNESKLLIVNINSELNDNFGNLSVAQSNLSANASFEGQDPFVQQFLETKEQTNIFSSFVTSIISIPDLLILGINDDINQADLQVWKILILSFITIILLVVGFVAIFGDGRIT